ncbi:MAG: 23S rRNA (adenine(2503)-C(2))-methyltransferase RlmN, partial [Defluviitaleaceae bacterium]|nr:23S rRNA (adenine(2503)-C(2))-methyltransferase RlmN [Defluviitaleaceae bacterium]
QFRDRLADHAYFSKVEIIQTQISKDSTKKFLFMLESCGMIEDENNSVVVEAVLMSYKHGLSLCISSQAGCLMGCDFCASGIHGLQRNLTAGEIVAQLYKIAGLEGQRISNLVLMGVGEPLDNYENVLSAIRLLNHEKGVNLGQRHITLSTCGLIDGMERLSKEDLQINLAVSLHAPNNQIRRKLMPVARSYDMEDLLTACKQYSKNGRRITFEYIMIDGVNDSLGNAQELARRIKPINCHVNLILANKVPEKGYDKSKDRNLTAFKDALDGAGIPVSIRRELGQDIDAACGQLRNIHNS